MTQPATTRPLFARTAARPPRAPVPALTAALVLVMALPLPFDLSAQMDPMDRSARELTRSPEHEAATALSRGSRLLTKAEKLAAEAAANSGDEKLAGKARALYEDARRDLEKAVAKAPHLPEANYKVGLVYLRLDEPEKAITFCRRAWERDHQLDEAGICEAAANLALDRPRKAQEIYLLLQKNGRPGAALVLRDLESWLGGHPDHEQAAALASWIEAEKSSG